MPKVFEFPSLFPCSPVLPTFYFFSDSISIICHDLHDLYVFVNFFLSVQYCKYFFYPRHVASALFFMTKG